MDLTKIFLFFLLGFISSSQYVSGNTRSRVPTRQLKRQDYNQYQSYQSGLVDNDIGVQYPSGPEQSSYAVFKKTEEDERKPVMFPSPPPPEQEEAASTPAPATEHVEQSERYISLPKNYAFSYSVKDQSSGDDFSHSQAHNGQSTKGEYRVKLPDGRMQIVSYTADNSGYRADVRYVMDESHHSQQNNYENQVPNYVHDFTNNAYPSDNGYEPFRDNHIRDYNPPSHYSPSAAPSLAPPLPSLEPSGPGHVNSLEYSGEYQVYNPKQGHPSGSGLGYYAEAPTPTTPQPSPAHLKTPKQLGHDVNYLLNLVTPTKHSLSLFHHTNLKPAHVSYETTTQNTELDNDLYGGKYNYNPVKSATPSTNKNQGMRYHYETMGSKPSDVKQAQGFRPSPPHYAPSVLVNVEPPNLGPAQPIQANYVTLPREKLPYTYGQSFTFTDQDNNYQANNIENSELKQKEQTTTEESLTMRPHIKYNTKPSVLQNSKPQKSTILHQPATPTPQHPKQYVSQTPSAQYYTSSITTAVPFNEISQHTSGTTLNSYTDYSGEYYTNTKPIQEDNSEIKSYKTPKKQFSKLVLPVTTIRPNYGPPHHPQPTHSPQPTYISHPSPHPSQQPLYTPQASYSPHPSPQPSHAPHPSQQSLYTPPPSYSPHPSYAPHTSSPQKLVFLQPSISPVYINSLEDNKPSLELSYLKDVPSDSVYLKHNADPTSQESSLEEKPRPYDSYSFSTSVSPNPTPLYTQAATSSEEYSKESLYSFVPSVRQEYDLGNAESSHYSSGSSEQGSTSASGEEQVSTTPKVEENKRQRKAATSSHSTISSSSSTNSHSSRRVHSNQERRRS
uniref:Pro-resilin n=1 Tax=Cacopsylla melanoneura TaxID=428564 RepID=A0A8D8QM83_9HEMI